MFTRRNFLKFLTLVTIVGYTGKVFGLDKKERVLNLNNVHTGERLNIKYYSSGIYDRDAMHEINHLMRCHFTNEVKPIDVKVLDLLCNIKDATGTNKEVLIISGYRSRQYNEYLRRIGRGVACNSLHLQGRAIDFRIPRVNNHVLTNFAKAFHTGGVCTYPDFVHIDDGSVRYW
jgi:uncharacterized protein YcbK (DUF882 family)